MLTPICRLTVFSGNLQGRLKGAPGKGRNALCHTGSDLLAIMGGCRSSLLKIYLCLYRKTDQISRPADLICVPYAFETAAFSCSFISSLRVSTLLLAPEVPLSSTISSLVFA
jgi:hypothetical protein